MVGDPITTILAPNLPETDKTYEILLSRLRILKSVAPLVRSRVLRFASPSRGYCAEHFQEFEDRIAEAIEYLMAAEIEYSAEVWVSPEKAALALHVPLLHQDRNHPLKQVIPISQAEAEQLKEQAGSASSKKFFRGIIRERLHENLKREFFALDSASRLNSLLIAASRAETQLIKALDKDQPGILEIEEWERMRTVNLPWIHNLTAEEVLILREEAGIALPRLRELLRLKVTQPANGHSDPLLETVAELRAQSLEVQSELDALKLPKERNFRAGMLGLSMLFVIYGLASGSPPLAGTSVTALLATLAVLRNAERETDEKHTKAISAPAYALLKAKEIIGQRSMSL